MEHRDEMEASMAFVLPDCTLKPGNASATGQKLLLLAVFSTSGNILAILAILGGSKVGSKPLFLIKTVRN